MAEFQIRDACRGDLPAMLALLNREIDETTATWSEQRKSLGEMEAWLAVRQGSGLPAVVAAAEGRVVGYAACGPFRPGSGYRFTVEHSLYVAPAAQGRGIGRALLEGLIARARASGLHAMVGGIGADNPGSIRLHARLGFVEVGRLPQAGRKFDRWLDLVLMQKLL